MTATTSDAGSLGVSVLGDAMGEPAIPLTEFDLEMATTRRLLERVPDEKGPWKPHEKSFPLGHLAQLVSGMPGWVAQTLRATELSLDDGPGYSFHATDALLKAFDDNVVGARKALAEVTGPALQVVWSLKVGGQIVFAGPRAEVVRNHLSHLIHHRGQLSVYLRLIDVPVPSIYGPTADERW
jgi:uncharacterized damage-inducible protein DinB